MSKIRTITVGNPVSNLNMGTKWYRRLLVKAEEVEPAPGAVRTLISAIPSEISFPSMSFWVACFHLYVLIR
jgi:hypothetical protein